MFNKPIIHSGDLLVWSNKSYTGMHKYLTNVIRFFTMSEYTHVGIAWKAGGHLFVIEAVEPCIRIFPVNKLKPFYFIPMGIDFTNEHTEYLLSKVGEPYSLKEVILGFLSTPDEGDKNWQCSEFVKAYYNHFGHDLNCPATPSGVVEAALKLKSSKLFYIN